MPTKEEIATALERAPEFVRQWTAIGLCTDAYTAAEVSTEIPAAMSALYTGCGLPAPIVDICDGPLSGAVIAGIVQHRLVAAETASESEHEAAIAEVVRRAEAAGGHPGTILPTVRRLLSAHTVRGGAPGKNDKLKKLTDAYLVSVKSIVSAADVGNEWPWCGACIEHARATLPGLGIDYAMWDLYLRTARYGVRYLLPTFALVCARPCVIRTDPQARLHRADGPAKAWPDGHAIYSWHGVVVPGSWVDRRPELVDVNEVVGHSNAEVRRAGCEIVGWERVLDVIHAVVVDDDPDPEIGTLFSARIEGDEVKVLRVRCGTGRTFFLRAPSRATTAREAQALKYAVTRYEPTSRT